MIRGLWSGKPVRAWYSKALIASGGSNPPPATKIILSRKGVLIPTVTTTIWTILSGFVTGFFTFTESLFNGIMASEIMSTLLIGIPVFAGLVGLVLGIVGLARKRKKRR